MDFLPTYYTMCYHDSTEKSPQAAVAPTARLAQARDAFDEGVAKAAAMESEEDGFNLPCKDRCYEAGIIAYLLGATTPLKKEKNNATIG